MKLIRLLESDPYAISRTALLRVVICETDDISMSLVPALTFLV